MNAPFLASDMKLLKVISLLLDYPTAELFDNGVLESCREIVLTSKLISPEVRQMISHHIDELQSLGELEAGAVYDSLFERGRLLSLWLFEHIHGESRDRGQAMVDLLAQYQEAGFEIGVKELPDYLPLYLEFLAYQAVNLGDEMQIRMDLADISHILALLGARLKEKDNPYVAYFYALLQIAGKSLAVIDEHLPKVSEEENDTTLTAIDKEWEEEMVSFLGAEQENCPSSQTSKRIATLQAEKSKKQIAVPVHWVDFSQPKTAQLEGAMS